MMNRPYNTCIPDVSLLKDPAIVDFLARQKPNTTIYFPYKAGQIAGEVIAFVNELAGHWLEAFLPHVAVKALRQTETLQAIFEAGFLADCASIREVHDCLEIGNGLITPQNIGFSNLWTSKQDLQKLVRMGVCSFVVDKFNVIDWIAQAAKSRPEGPPIRVTIRILQSSIDQGKKFGALPENVRPLAEYARKHGLLVDGVAFHVGSSNSLKGGPEMFDNFARAIKDIAPLCNQLHTEGLIGSLVNTEGGYSLPYVDEEFTWQSIMVSQAQAFQEAFDYPVQWKIEPGRLFGASAVSLVLVNNVDDGKRAGTAYPVAGLSDSVYLGPYEDQWEQRAYMRLSDVKEGKLYQFPTHPEMFARFIAVGPTCAGSDQKNTRGNRGDFIWLPKDIKPGDVLVKFPDACYTSSALGPGGFQKSTRRWYGFNGIPWPRIVVYPGNSLL